MDQGHELKKLERRHKEAIDGILFLLQEIVAELKLEPAKANHVREKLQRLYFLMR